MGSAVKILDTTPTTTIGTGSLQVGGGTSIYGSTIMRNSLNILDTTPATSITTGALKVAGGASIYGSTFLGNALTVADTTAATILGTGALQVAGGGSVQGDFWIGGILHATGLAGGNGPLTTTNTTNATSLGTGALIVSAGGASVAGDMYIGGALHGPGGGALQLVSAAGTNIGGNVDISGALVVKNAVTFSNTLNVGSAATFSNTLSVNSAATFNDTLNVASAATFSNTLNVNSTATFSNVAIKGGNWITDGTYQRILFNGDGSTYFEVGTLNDYYFRCAGVVQLKIESTGDLTATGNITAYSDRRLKDNIVTVDSALDKVMKMRGVYYNRIDSKTRSIGVIAQEVEEVLPEVVFTDSKDMKSVAYGNIVGLLIEAIKEQQSTIDSLLRK
jgi:hypothetical protein